jgi:hypothetical protein
MAGICYWIESLRDISWRGVPRIVRQGLGRERR